MRSVFSLLVVIALGLAAGFVHGEGPADDPAGNPEFDHVLLVLGDSLSAAYAMERSESWPSLLQDRLTENGHSYRVFNSSIVGDTTESGLSRLPRLLGQLRPSIVIIELGGNDGLRGLPLDVTRSNLQNMIDQSQAAGARVILAGIQLPPNYGKTYTEGFSAMYPSLSQQAGTALIPFLLEGVALDPSLMMEDGIHPTAAAQPLVLDTVWQAVKGML
jgi:acyl-CoA thioesterase-1